jgi:hypothetical protein
MIYSRKCIKKSFKITRNNKTLVLFFTIQFVEKFLQSDHQMQQSFQFQKRGNIEMNLFKNQIH